MTQRRKRHRQHGNPFTVRGEIAVPDWASVFGRTAPFALDIGCGAGAFTLELARRHPEWNVVGLEIRRHFVDGINEAARAAGLGNVHAVLANANAHLEVLLPDAGVVFVALNFPDPWFKKRHQKRRVLRPDWVPVLLCKLAPGAELHVMTDYLPVAEQIAGTLARTAQLTRLSGTAEQPFAAASTTDIQSERERTHLRRGTPIYRLAYRYRP
jgi:tRNA (guanine-N7-)-methyltransferase